MSQPTALRAKPELCSDFNIGEMSPPLMRREAWSATPTHFALNNVNTTEFGGEDFDSKNNSQISGH